MNGPERPSSKPSTPESSKYRRTEVAISWVAAHPNQCPNCESKTVRVHGYWKRRFVRPVVAGAAQEEQIEERYLEGVDAIVCESCQLRFDVVADRVVGLERDLLTERLGNAEDSLRVVIPDKPGRVN
jgi:ribosomal protein L37AE/L43A